MNKGSEKKNADTEPKQKKTRDKKKLLKVIVAILLVLTAIYNFVVYTSIPAIKNLRDAYIDHDSPVACSVGVPGEHNR